MKYNLLIVVLFVFAQNLAAQETEQGINQNTGGINLVQFYDSELFQWNYNMLGGLSLNYQNQNSGISFGINDAMKNALLEFPDSGQAYNSYKKKNTAGNILIYGGLALILGAYIPLYNQVLDDNPNNFDRNMGWSIGLASSGVVSTMVGSFVFSSGTESLFNAVNLFNRNKVRVFN